MKRIFSFLLALTATLTAMANQGDHAMLKLRLSNQATIAVNIDGRYISRQTASLTLDGLRPGLHRVEVYRTDGRLRRPLRIYTGTIRLKAGTVNIGIVDVSQRMLRMRIRPMDEQDLQAYTDTDEKRNEDGGKRDDDRDRDERSDDYDRDDIYRKNYDRDDAMPVEEGYGSFPHGRESRSSEHHAGNILSSDAMDELGSQVNSQVTDTDKEKLLKSKLKNKSVKTAQVRIMMGWLSFESTRLDFAKWAYNRTTDPENYRKLEDVFDFNASRDEFNKAIGSR